VGAAASRNNREGIVFKRLDAPYTPGKPNSGGPQLKFKFVRHAVGNRCQGEHPAQCGDQFAQRQELDFVRQRHHPGQSHAFPKVGAVVEVRYLYAYRASHALHQPVYLGPRDDVDPGECLASQLKFKAE
jgi:bifunctional non-homologous end joining protein LigD